MKTHEFGFVDRIKARINEPDPDGKPRNGLPGMKYWRQDLFAAFVVSLIATSFGLAIAGDSKFPYVAGIISAIVAGLVLPFLGGSYVTVSGPAAALAPILAGFVTWLGMGNDQHGRELLILAIAFVGIVQIILYKLKVARYVSAYLPPAVVEGMLGGIGFGIIVKQIPKIFGVKFHNSEPLQMILEAPEQVAHIQPTVFGLGCLCVGLVIFLSFQKWKWLKKMPPAVVAVIVGTIIGAFLVLPTGARISIPDNIREAVTVINPTHLSEVLADRGLLLKMLVAIVILTMVDGVESIATVKQVDRADLYKRISDPNRTLGAMGVSNISSALVGGMTIIPGGIKSNAAIMLGACTQWCNFFTAAFLIFYLWIGKPIINMIPLAALAAVMVAAGWKLCGVAKWKKMATIGREQLVVFAITMIATVATNELLLGLGIGIVCEILCLSILSGLSPIHLFRSPINRIEESGNEVHIYFGRPLVSFGLPHVEDALKAIGSNAASLFLHFDVGVIMVDHASTEVILDAVERFEKSGRGEAHALGLQALMRVSDHQTCMRIRALNKPGLLRDEVPPIPPFRIRSILHKMGIGVATADK